MCLCLKVCKGFTIKLPTTKWALKTPRTTEQKLPISSDCNQQKPPQKLFTHTPTYLTKSGYFKKLPTPSYNKCHALLKQKLSIIHRWTSWTTDKKAITMFYLVRLEWQLYGSCNFLQEMHTCIPMPSKGQYPRIYPYTKYKLRNHSEQCKFIQLSSYRNYRCPGSL